MKYLISVLLLLIACEEATAPVDKPDPATEPEEKAQLQFISLYGDSEWEIYQLQNAELNRVEHVSIAGNELGEVYINLYRDISILMKVNLTDLSLEEVDYSLTYIYNGHTGQSKAASDILLSMDGQLIAGDWGVSYISFLLDSGFDTVRVDDFYIRNDIHHLKRFSESKFLIGTHRGQIYMYDEITKQVSEYITVLRLDHINEIFLNNDKSITWVDTEEGLYQDENGSWVSVDSYFRAGVIKDDQLWYSRNDTIVRRELNTVEYFSVDSLLRHPIDNSYLKLNLVHSFLNPLAEPSFITNKGQIIVVKNDHFKKIDIPFNLENAFRFDVFIDTDQSVWFANHKGLLIRYKGSFD